MKNIYLFEVMTTPCELQLVHNNKTFCDEVASQILKESKRLELKYNYFDSNSLISKINSRVENSLDMESRELLKRAKSYYRATNSIFDVTIATIKELYKLQNLDEFNRQKEELSKYIGCEHFEIKRDKIYFDNAFTKIDFGGFVKEYAVDRAVKIIKKNKIKSAIVNFGGDLFVIGRKVDGQKYRVGIKNPLKKEENLLFVELEDEALTTSASYERNYQIEDKKFSHIISKKSLESKILSASVISKNCMESGVYSTALMIDSGLKQRNRVILIDEELRVC